MVCDVEIMGLSKPSNFSSKKLQSQEFPIRKEKKIHLATHPSNFKHPAIQSIPRHSKAPIGFQHEGFPFRELKIPAFPVLRIDPILVVGFVLPMDIIVETLWPLQRLCMERAIRVLSRTMAENGGVWQTNNQFRSTSGFAAISQREVLTCPGWRGTEVVWIQKSDWLDW